LINTKCKVCKVVLSILQKISFYGWETRPFCLSISGIRNFPR
jgi:hypothetical protein